jgi:hypothetical protein
MQIRNPDPALYLNAGLAPASRSQTNADRVPDPGRALKSQKVVNMLGVGTAKDQTTYCRNKQKNWGKKLN